MSASSSSKKNKSGKKLWGGRFAKTTDPVFEQFSESVSFDWQLYDVDIAGSIAHATMLCKIGVLTDKEKNQIVRALQEIKKQIDTEGIKAFDVRLEDVHMNIETMLIAKIGDVGRKLHTGRSRNDQVALDLRMKLKQWNGELQELLRECQKAMVGMAQHYKDAVIPEFTHTQHAQPVLLAHHLLAYVEMWQRDGERLKDFYQRLDVMPLGSGACVGSGLPLDRELVRKELGFAVLSANSVDAVSDRDFVAEFLFVLSLLTIHLSRLCEEWILWSSTEFAFIELSDAYCTGSSMMPQKKNADALELMRGLSGSVCGDLLALLTMLKGLPLSYNRDMQDDKRRLFETYVRVKQALQIMKGVISTTTINTQRCQKAAESGYAYATDIADYLVKKGMPFREAHHVVGELVGECVKQEIEVADMPLARLKKASNLFEKDIFQAMQLKSCVDSKDVVGGTAPQQVMKQLKRWKELLAL